MSKVGRRRGVRAEDGAGASGGSSKELVIEAGLLGTTELLQLGKGLLACRGHLGLVAAQLNEEQSELLGLSQAPQVTQLGNLNTDCAFLLLQY